MLYRLSIRWLPINPRVACGELGLNYPLQVSADHLGQSEQEDRDGCQLFGHFSTALAPCIGSLRHLTAQQAKSQRDIVRIEAFRQLSIPCDFLRRSDIHWTSS